MVIEYKIKFEEDGVTITQSVDPLTAKAKDSGGDFPEKPDDPGGDFPEKPDDPGGDFPEKPDDGGGTGRGRLIAVVLGPLVIGNCGPAQGGAIKVQPESVINVPVLPVRP